MFDLNLRSITIAGILLLVFLFSSIIFYMTVSGPISTVLDGFDDADVGDASDEMDSFLPGVRIALSMAFAIFVITPVAGFVMWVFSREPFYERYRRY